jgi:hypothetical protein
MLYPEGPWGSRLARGFRQQWTTLGGRVAADQAYDPAANDFSESIERLLGAEGTDSGQGPAADFIFLVATAQKAGEIWPQIRAAAGPNVPPVFCTSHIHSTQFNVQGNPDLAGLYFVDIPWLIAPNPGDPLSIQSVGRDLPQMRSDYIRLYAMGIDAYRIAPRLVWMSSHPNAVLHGETGTLRLDSLRRVRRELPLARMEAGGPVLAAAGHAPSSAGESMRHGASTSTPSTPRHLRIAASLR